MHPCTHTCTKASTCAHSTINARTQLAWWASTCPLTKSEETCKAGGMRGRGEGGVQCVGGVLGARGWRGVGGETGDQEERGVLWVHRLQSLLSGGFVGGAALTQQQAQCPLSLTAYLPCPPPRAVTLSGLSPCLPLRFLHADARPPRSCSCRRCGRWWPALSCTISSLDSRKGGACTRQALWSRGQSGPTNAWDLSGEQAANLSPSAGLKTAARARESPSWKEERSGWTIWPVWGGAGSGIR